ncbi:unnamed protein product [Candida verbasci]|uniref:Holocytochrome c-type synthase n=1 Tax=Candida verbasci TaxID=1227364 RepID=A0A9W4XF06_9ASCO|nr:unnamed protein product [Candida verbasci]
MGWFWATNNPTNHDLETSASSACPVDHSKYATSKCPVLTDSSDINPLNNMPHSLSSQKAPGQTINLSTQRTTSTIPSADNSLWEYPSPQQMLNAMLRKGKLNADVPEDAVESMVEVHNFLNEGAWQQILEWEAPYTQDTKIEPRLKNFTGKPFDMSPKARFYLLLGEFFPESFNTVPPFDRHDWFVLRSLGRDKGWKEVRYVIDYYGGPDDIETGMPTFILDTRPALDDFGTMKDRLIKWAKPTWEKAMGERI